MNSLINLADNSLSIVNANDSNIENNMKTEWSLESVDMSTYLCRKTS